jgi:putative tryptophan/tyrosine transport system substrate-binding protein
VTRRSLVLAVALSLAAIAIVGRAQQATRMPVVGLLALSAGPHDQVYEAVRKGLDELGYVEGRDFRFEYRGAQGHVDQLPRLAEELVRLKVDVILAGAADSARAAKTATTTIPIVAVLYDYDHVESGLIDSLARPGGNITGIFARQSQLIPKRVELLKETLPSVSRVALLTDTLSPGERDAVKSAAEALGIQVEVLDLRAPQNLDAAFKAAKHMKVGAVVVGGSPWLYVERLRIGALARENGLPAFSGLRDLTAAGGLMSYSNDIRDTFRRVAYYIDRLLKGTNPRELPVEQIERFQLVVNLKTAKALAITVPQSILLRADEVIR